MPGQAIGLDIGTSAVRAAQLSVARGAVTLERFGEVPLPPGAVRDGELQDRDALVAAVKTLWRQFRMGGKKVVLGVANQKVVVRQVELPWVPRTEMRKTLPEHVQDFIPMPVDAAVLDFHMFTEQIDERGRRMMDGLLVAASRDMVLAMVEAVQAAGLRPVAVDLSSFALIRSLAWPYALPVPPAGPPAPAGPPEPTPASSTVPAPRGGDTAPLQPAPAEAELVQPPSPPPAAVPVEAPVEALVDVGARVTDVVVHRAGVPLFVRILLMGGQNVAEAVAERTGTDVAQADETVRNLGMARQDATAPSQAEPAARAIEVAGAELVEEVRGSLDYYVASSGSAPVSRILLCGGGARIGGLAQRMAEASRTTVDYAHPLTGINIGGVRMSPEQLAYLEPVTAVAIGLGRGAAS